MRALFVALLLAAGCGDTDGLLVVEVVSDEPTTTPLLQVTVTAGGQKRDLAVARGDKAAFTLPQTFAVQFPPKYAGAVSLTVVALDDAMKPIATGMQDATIAAGERKNVSVSLVHKPRIDLTPPSVTLTIGKTQQFTASLDVTWSLAEMGGGTIDAQGLYRAPLQPGTFHVIATLKSDATITASATVDVQDKTLQLLAGQLGGSGNVDGIGAEARFSDPQPGAVDGAGTAYLTDSNNQNVRSVKLSTGEVKTIAGAAGQRAFADGAGPDARFSLPAGLQLDGAGNLYIADYGNAIVRKLVLATNIVSTIAGQFGQVIGHMDGVGANARFGGPAGLVFDRGSLYTGDVSGSYTVRKIDLTGFQVSTVAGTIGTPGFNDGTGVGNNKVDYVEGIAGNQFDRLWLADSSTHTIRELLLSTGALTTIAGTANVSGSADAIGAAARFNQPSSIVYDGVGSLYVADGSNYTIRKVDTTTHAVTTVAGTAGQFGSTDGTGPAARFHRPHGLALTSGALVIGDGAVRLMSTSTFTVTTVAGLAGKSGTDNGPAATATFQNQDDLAVDEAGNVYVYQLGTDDIRKISGGQVSTLGQAGEPGKIVYAGGGKLLIAMNNGIHRMDTTTGMTEPVVPTGAGYPSAIEPDGKGTLYIAGGNQVLQATLSTGAVTTLAGQAVAGATDGVGTAASFSAISGLAYDGTGALYVADGSNFTIRKIELATKQVTTIAGLAGIKGTSNGTGAMARFDGLGKIVCDRAIGALYIAEQDSTVRKLVLATGEVTTYAGVSGRQGVRLGPLPASLNFARSSGLSLGANGDLYMLGEGAILVVR